MRALGPHDMRPPVLEPLPTCIQPSNPTPISRFDPKSPQTHSNQNQNANQITASIPSHPIPFHDSIPINGTKRTTGGDGAGATEAAHPANNSRRRRRRPSASPRGHARSTTQLCKQKKKNTTVTTQTPPPPPDKGEASARAYEGGEVEVAVATRRDATRYKGKGGFGRRKGEQLFLVLSRGSAWSRESTRDRRRSEQEEEEGTTTTTTALRCAT